MPTADTRTAADDGWLRVRRHWGVIVVSVFGHLDAHNAPRLFGLLGPFASLRDGLIVDLSALDYCGVAGLRMLVTLGAGFHRVHTPWVLVPGPVPARLLVLAHHPAALPVAATVDEAARLLGGQSHPPRLYVVH